MLSGSGPTVLGLARSQEAALESRAALLESESCRRARRHRTGRRRARGGVRRSGCPNLLNLEKVSKSYGVRILLDEVSLGVGEGERIGIVGRNGDGKTTLLNLMAGREVPDAGRVSTNRGLQIGYLDQRDLLDDTHTVREVVLAASREDHEWAADARMREVVEVLLAGVALDREVHGLSGGERRRCSLARLLLAEDDLLILDEPTNHLDVEAVAWLAEHLVRRPSALVVVTHDRWFLDAVCDRTWEVHPAANGAGRGRRLRRRVRRLRARQGRTAAPGLRLRVAAPEPRPQGAGLAAARPARADLEAEVPHRRGQRPDRGRAAAARPDGAAAVRHPAARQGRRRPRGRRPDPRRAAAARARHLAARSR